MMNYPSSAGARLLPRRRYLALIDTALQTGESRFARDAALSWLAAYPGDLEMNLRYAQALLAENQPKTALQVLDHICQTDPEYLEAAETRLQAEERCEGRHWPESIAAVLALSDQLVNQQTVVSWGRQLWLARQCLQNGELEQAEDWIRSCLGSNPNTPLVAVTHLRILEAQGDDALAARCRLADFYHQRWPRCVAVTLLLADWLMDGGSFDQAVALLHQAAAHDVGGQVARRLWGPDHPYLSMWPDRLEARLDHSIPASVASLLGWNQLGSGDSAETAAAAAPQETRIEERGSAGDKSPDGAAPAGEAAVPAAKTIPDEVEEEPVSEPEETIREVQEELERVAKSLNHPEAVQGDGRFPVYILFSTRCGLERLYGPQGADAVTAEMDALAEVFQQRGDWGARVFLPDLADYTTPLDLHPVNPADAWALKLALSDLDTALGKRGERVGAVLIVGGPEVVPFHHLPNPIDDDDADVPSDNPYASRDENYFIPEWPLGRMPGGSSKDPALLLSLLRGAREYHAREVQKIAWWKQFWSRLLEWLRPRVGRETISLGYSAAVWQKASRQVFASLPNPGNMYLSPPLNANGTAPKDMSGLPLPPARLGYFNLHGLVDAAEWYGQRDPLNDPEGDEYPVAIRPQDVSMGGIRAPQIVFSEACYGAHILGKCIEDAMALKFLSTGSQVVVSSTGMAYGSIGTPLIAADLLGEAFWNFLKRGLPAGEALLRAKIHLAQEMHQRQGYLDGEDQKTLISFVLYGDPFVQLTSPRPSQSKLAGLNGAKTWLKTSLKTVSDRVGEDDREASLPPEMMNYVKHVVAHYLPGMEGAQVTYSSEVECCPPSGHATTNRQAVDKSRPGGPPARQIVTLSKQVVRSRHVHNQYARLKLDAQGKLVKLAVSR